MRDNAIIRIHFSSEDLTEEELGQFVEMIELPMRFLITGILTEMKYPRLGPEKQLATMVSKVSSESETLLPIGNTIETP